MQLMPEVPETLDYLAQRHRLFMVTKGNFTEQTGKLERSELKKHFTGVEVLTEKNAAAYREVVDKYGLLHEQTWMIGNSPSSDINPALAAGLHAVFVPHHNTWELERGEILPANGDRRLLHVESFAQLRDVF
jgi:putative hydrolase of the HAD superfamily